ncbi:MAG: hypothetical protein ACI93P_002733 [bacterium]|jgi:hypothetical protein
MKNNGKTDINFLLVMKQSQLNYCDLNLLKFQYQFQ